jgi:hypothetical protein
MKHDGFVLIFWVVLLVLYFIPAIIGELRRHRNAMASGSILCKGAGAGNGAPFVCGRWPLVRRFGAK